MCLYPVRLSVKRKNSEIAELMDVACGKCVECLQAKSTEWSFRIMDEVSLHNDNCFITLTYNDEHLPVDSKLGKPTLFKKDLQNFMKRLRKALRPLKVRYFACGEYGSKGSRPHYHLILFGYKPSDLVFLKTTAKGEAIYTSKIIQKAWSLITGYDDNGDPVYTPIGYISVGDVTLDSAKYCAKYLQKLNNVPTWVEKPFITMSNRPGIGFNAFNPSCLSGDRIYHNGKGIKVPRYYLKIAEREGMDVSSIIVNRCLIAKLNPVTLEDLENRRKRSQKILLRKFVKTIDY